MREISIFLVKMWVSNVICIDKKYNTINLLSFLSNQITHQKLFLKISIHYNISLNVRKQCILNIFLSSKLQSWSHDKKKKTEKRCDIYLIRACFIFFIFIKYYYNCFLC